jgi:predicted MPP superfamily phosphohydrolase
VTTGLGLAVWAVLIEPAWVVARESSVPIARWPAALGPLKIVALSDLHTGAPHITVERLRDIVTTVNAARPDLIVLLGDYVIHGVVGGRFVEPEPAAAALRDLTAPLGVFAVLGNHDWWYDGARVTRALEGVGIRVLEDAAVSVTANGRPRWIAGVSDALTRRALARAGALGPAAQQRLERYHHAIELYRSRRWEDARRRLDELDRETPGDGPVALYRRRAQQLLAQPPSDDWDGVFVSESK